MKLEDRLAELKAAVDEFELAVKGEFSVNEPKDCADIQDNLMKVRKELRQIEATLSYIRKGHATLLSDLQPPKRKRGGYL